MIYLDHAATTPLDPRVLEAMLPHLRETWGNPSSPHAKGRQARAVLEEARDTIAALCGVLPNEVIFTGSGSESVSLAVRGVCDAWIKQRGVPGHIVTSVTEHSCTLTAMERMEERGWTVTRLPVDSEGNLSLSDVESALEGEVTLVSLHWANNETGALFPISEIAALCKEKAMPFHCDAVQGAGLLALPSPLPDLVSIAAHKFCGPKGVGILLVRDDLHLTPQTGGGGQEFGLRSGTENVAGAVGAAKALALAYGDMKEANGRMAALRDTFEAEILTFPNTERNGSAEHRLPTISNIWFRGHDAQTLVIKLDEKGICVSNGAACASGAAEASHVLIAMRKEEAARESLRFSLGRGTSKEEIDETTSALRAIL